MADAVAPVALRIADDVGLGTGNRKVNPTARVLVVVAEILLNRLLHADGFDFGPVSAVVMPKRILAGGVEWWEPLLRRIGQMFTDPRTWSATDWAASFLRRST